MNWSIRAIAFWVAWVLAFFFWETVAGIDKMGARDIPMLTQVIVRYVPWWVTMPVLGWLVVHFGTRYFNPAYIAWLKGNQ